MFFKGKKLSDNISVDFMFTLLDILLFQYVDTKLMLPHLSGEGMIFFPYL